MNTSNLGVSSEAEKNIFNIAGVINADNGHFEEALEYFDKAIQSDPKNYSAYFNRASIRMHFGDIDGARRDFLECEKLHKKNSYLV